MCFDKASCLWWSDAIYNMVVDMYTYMYVQYVFSLLWLREPIKLLESVSFYRTTSRPTMFLLTKTYYKHLLYNNKNNSNNNNFENLSINVVYYMIINNHTDFKSELEFFLPTARKSEIWLKLEEYHAWSTCTYVGRKLLVNRVHSTDERNTRLCRKSNICHIS